MNHDGSDPLARLLGEAFDAQARDAVGDHTRPPAPRFLDAPADSPAAAPRRRTRVWAPIAAAAAVVAVVAGVLGVSGGFGGGDGTPVASRTGTSLAPSTGSSSETPKALGIPAAAGATAVEIRTLNTDGATYGVGMPLVAYFSQRITDGRSLQAATTATVNGTPIQGAWYFETSSAERGFPVEGHFRPRTYWPAHSAVHVDIAAKGLSAGTGMGFVNDVSIRFTIGAAQILTVDANAHTLTVVRDGTKLADYRVSLGASDFRTQRGIKVIMEKGRQISMRGPGYYDPSVQDTQRLTYSGEYLHSAPWNVTNIDKGIDSSNGCTNLRPADASALFATTQVGDVVSYPNANGSPMTVGEGFGDWNVPWTTWLSGGLVRTR